MCLFFKDEIWNQVKVILVMVFTKLDVNFQIWEYLTDIRQLNLNIDANLNKFVTTKMIVFDFFWKCFKNSL